MSDPSTTQTRRIGRAFRGPRKRAMWDAAEGCWRWDGREGVDGADSQRGADEEDIALSTRN